MTRRFDVEGVGGVRLAAWEFADPPKTAETDRQPGVLLLHGLMGRAAHWAGTCRWLSERHRAVALDQRGHGRSGKPSADRYTRDSYVGDAEAALVQLQLAPAVLVGHAMGALTAWQLAVRRPDLVRGLVLYDVRASALGVAAHREWQEWFRSWPESFATLADVRRWFGEEDPWLERPSPPRGAYYAEVMTESDDGWRPMFDPAHIIASREAWVYEAYWDELAQVRCPTLVVRGLDGELGRAEAQEMVRVLPRGAYAEIPDTSQFLHYGQPGVWRAAVEPFLEGVLAD